VSKPTRRRLLVAGVAAATTGILAAAFTAMAPAALAATLFSDNFESGLASSWSKSGGTWAIATDGSQVLQQSNAGSALARQFNGSTSWTDYSLQARVKPLSLPGSGSFAGIAARATSATTFYRLLLLSGNRVQLEADNSGSVTVLGSASLTVSTGTFYTLRLDVNGSTISGFVNGTQIASATNTMKAAGRIGLQTNAASANFDDVSVSSIGTPPPTTAPPPTTSSPRPSPSTSTSQPPPPPPGNIEGYGAGTTGGGNGPVVTVSNLADLTAAVSASTAQTVRLNGNITCSDDVRIASNKTVIGVGANSGLTGCGFGLRNVDNIILRNMKIAKVPASNGNGDAIHIDHSTHLWIDHNDLSSDTTHGTDFYDGLLDITHAADLITVSWNFLHDHIKCSLIGHSDNNASEDTGHLHVTYHHNFFSNCDQRMPSLRFGTGHVYNNFFSNGTTGVHSRMGAQMLVQNNVWRNVGTPIETTRDSDVDGFVNESGNDFGGGTNLITQTGNFTNPPYSFHLDATGSVMSIVTAGAGTGKIG
jgi:pectate lyase